jgi:hypothetical protein
MPHFLVSLTALMALSCATFAKDDGKKDKSEEYYQVIHTV